MVNSLPTRTESQPGQFYVLNASSTSDNVFNSSHLAKASSKHWMCYILRDGYFDLIDGVVAGDVNGDGDVTSADVTALYGVLLSNDYSSIVNGDQDGDG